MQALFLLQYGTWLSWTGAGNSATSLPITCLALNKKSRNHLRTFERLLRKNLEHCHECLPVPCTIPQYGCAHAVGNVSGAKGYITFIWDHNDTICREGKSIITDTLDYAGVAFSGTFTFKTSTSTGFSPMGPENLFQLAET